MKMIISWNELNVIEVIRIENKYFSKILVDNIALAIKEGMPMISIANIKLVSKSLPQFILSRIPQKCVRDKYLKNISSYEGENIINYINTTSCKLATDNFKISIEK